MTNQDIEAALQRAATTGPDNPDAREAQMDRVARRLIFQASTRAATDAASAVREALKNHPALNRLALRKTAECGNLVVIARWEDCG